MKIYKVRISSSSGSVVHHYFSALNKAHQFAKAYMADDELDIKCADISIIEESMDQKTIELPNGSIWNLKNGI